MKQYIVVVGRDDKEEEDGTYYTTHDNFNAKDFMDASAKALVHLSHYGKEYRIMELRERLDY